MTVSQNGWAVIGSSTSKVLRPWVIGPVTLPGRTGPPGFVLAHFAQWYHEEIERLWPEDMPDHDDHWWGLRRIGGTDVWSNHASATAIDLNARRHPQGTSVLATFTPTQARRINTKLDTKYVSNGLSIIKWGGNFSTTPDSMHYELRDLEDAPKTEVHNLAMELVDTPVGRRLISAQVKPVKWEAW